MYTDLKNLKRCGPFNQLQTESPSLCGCDADSDKQNDGTNNEECSVYLPDKHVAAIWIYKNILSWFLGGY